MRTLQKELDELREDRSREKDLTARRVREDEEEIQILRERCERLEAQNSNQVIKPAYIFVLYSLFTLSMIYRVISISWSSSVLTWKA